MIEEFIQLSISTVGVISQSEALRLVSEVLSVVVGYVKRWRCDGAFIPSAGVSRQAYDHIGAFSDPVHH